MQAVRPSTQRCGRIVFYKHRAADGNEHYRRGVNVCRKASCSVPGCRRHWTTERREEIFARAEPTTSTGTLPGRARRLGRRSTPCGPLATSWTPSPVGSDGTIGAQELGLGGLGDPSRLVPVPHGRLGSSGHFYGMRTPWGSDVVGSFRDSCEAEFMPGGSQGNWSRTSLDWAALKITSRRGRPEGCAEGDPTGSKILVGGGVV